MTLNLGRLACTYFALEDSFQQDGKVCYHYFLDYVYPGASFHIVHTEGPAALRQMYGTKTSLGQDHTEF